MDTHFTATLQPYYTYLFVLTLTQAVNLKRFNRALAKAVSTSRGGECQPSTTGLTPLVSGHHQLQQPSGGSKECTVRRVSTWHPCWHPARHTRWQQRGRLGGGGEYVGASVDESVYV